MCIDVKLQLRKINRLMRKLEVYKKEDLQNVQFSFWDAGDCWLLLAAAGRGVLSCDAVAFVSSTSKSIGSFSEVAGVANNWCGVQGIQSIDVGVAITASVVSTGAATAVAATSTVATGVAAANTSTGVPVASSTSVANTTTTTYSTAPACAPALPCPLELKLEL